MGERHPTPPASLACLPSHLWGSGIRPPPSASPACPPPPTLRYAATDKADLGTETDTNTNQVRCMGGGALIISARDLLKFY